MGRGLKRQGLDPIGDLLRRLSKLGDGPVGGVSLGHVVGPGVVDQPLGERGRQHQLALGDGDEGVAEAVEPELGTAGLADAGVKMMRVLDVAGRAGRRRATPRSVSCVLGTGIGQAARDERRMTPLDHARLADCPCSLVRRMRIAMFAAVALGVVVVERYELVSP